MRWQNRRQSTNVEDRRRMSGPKVAAGGGCGVLLLVIVIALLGGNPMALLEQMGSVEAPSSTSGGPVNAEDEELAEFVRVILADTEDVWNTLFAQKGMTYKEPTLVLFTGRVQSACGFASAAMGPFYCPPDQHVYIDLEFFRELRDKFGAPGDFAQAYVIAHEIGHHVQNLLGISDQVHQMQGRLGKAEYNELSVRLELQADYLAGVWAHHAQRMKNILEEGDIEEGLRAANAIGDDTLQRRAQGYVVPDAFTHGTSEQRMRWFMLGLRSGDMDAGDTFNAEQL